MDQIAPHWLTPRALADRARTQCGLVQFLPGTAALARGCAVAVLATAMAADAMAGPDWEESLYGDAGPLLSTAQVVTGIGTLSTIRGTLEAFADSGDFQDMYRIEINCPAAITFKAGTDPSFGGSGDFNTQLWLFNANGLGLLGNNDVTPSLGLSGFGNMSTDGTGIVISAPGTYYIAVSGLGSVPINSAGQALFSFVSPMEVSGPDGPGGSTPIAGWSGPGASGEYIIGFSTCAKFVPPPTCPADLNGDGLVNGADLGLLLNAWGPFGTAADLNGDGQVNGADLGLLIAAWGPCTAVGR